MSHSTKLYASVYVKQFPAQALLRLRPQHRNKPVAILDGIPPLQTVCAFNAKAHSIGVRRGMTRVDMGAFPTLEIWVRSRREEAMAHAALLECTACFSPRVEDCTEDTFFLCVLDIAGTHRLFGSPQTLAEALLHRIDDLGIKASIVVSHNVHAAHLCVRGISSSIAIIPHGEEGNMLAPLPIQLLTISDERAQTFSLWGIHTLGALAALPEQQLVARMGQEGQRLHRLATGTHPHHLMPVEVPLALNEKMELDAPLELLDSLMFVIGVMLEQLILRATTQLVALASVTITLALERGASHTRTVKPALPCIDRSLWIKLLHLDLEAHPPLAAIHAVSLHAEPGSTSKVQLGLFSPQLPEPARLDITLARIRALVGDDCVGRPVLLDGHQLDGFRLEPFTLPTGRTSASSPLYPYVATRQLRPPLRATVSLQDKRPISLVFRNTQYKIKHAYGPWMSTGAWWSDDRWATEQWDLIANSNHGIRLDCCLVHNLIHEPRNDLWHVVALYD